MRPNQTYEVVPEQPDASSNEKAYKAVPFDNIHGNTEIPAIRLFEKIKNYKATHKDLFEQISELRIACFGKLSNIEDLQSLCKKERLCSQVSLTSFEQDRNTSGYFFKASAEFSSGHSEETYDLLHNADLESLFDSYHIVLFLDLNCFYRQYQGIKTVDEKSTQTNCQWYWDRSEQLFKFKSKTVYYKLIYDQISMWLNSYRKEHTGRYEFDEDLFHTLDTAYKYKADVYLYLGYGDQISGKKLRDYNICNDEYYDGKELIVYKFISMHTNLSDNYYQSFLNNVNKISQLKITINLWRLVKSISNSFYRSLLQEIQQYSPEFQLEDIMDISCILNCTDILEDSTIKISYYLQDSRQRNPVVQKILEQIIKTVLEQSFGIGSLACINRYFRNLIVHYIVSNSESIDDLIFAYLLSAGQFSRVLIDKKDWRLDDKACTKVLINEGTDFKARSTLYSIINRLADLRLRAIDDRTNYFVEGFRRSYCPDMSEKVFRDVMLNIRQSCEKWRYTDSRLYVNSKIE